MVVRWITSEVHGNVLLLYIKHLLQILSLIVEIGLIICLGGMP